MKTEKEKIKEIFSKYLGQRTSAPDFEFMWLNAAEGNRKKRLWSWRIAASVGLIVTVGIMAIRHHQDSRKSSGLQITSWTEPTGILIPPQTDIQVIALTHWASPTGFLLPKYNHPTK